MKRVACYVRVSTQEQKQRGLSVDSQIVALKDYCTEKGYEVVGVYNDAGISARKRYTKRPALLNLIEDCKRGRIDLIIFTKLDRWFRSVADYYEVQKVLDEKKIPWRAIWEDYETETSSGVFKVNIMLSVAQSEADRTSERIKAVNEYRRAQGRYINGKAPTGYMLQGGGLVIDEGQRPAMRAFFDTYLSCFSVIDAMNAARDLGLQFARDTARKLLMNPTYKGDAHGYECEAYITAEQWSMIQRSLDSRRIRRRKYFDHVFYFTNGLLRCGSCGAHMIGSTRINTVNGVKKPFKYYKCGRARNVTCAFKTTISEMKVEAFLLDNLAAAVDDYNMSLEAMPVDQASIEADIAKLKGRLSRIGTRFEEGEISKEEYIEKKDAVQREISRLENMPTRKRKALQCDWREVYAELDASHRRAFWYQTVSEITFGPNGLDFKLE